MAPAFTSTRGPAALADTAGAIASFHDEEGQPPRCAKHATAAQLEGDHHDELSGCSRRLHGPMADEHRDDAHETHAGTL